MQKQITHLAAAALIAVSASSLLAPHAQSRALPDPPVIATDSIPGSRESIVFAGGCFWGVEAVFEHVKGVTEVVSGYAGGDAATANYETVSSGKTGHAESVKVTFDPSQISAGQLMKVFFAVATDPTQLNFQGPDHGPQYRSEIFFTTAEQEKIANDYIAQLTKTGIFKDPIVTKIEPLKEFFPAEEYHQNYAALHPDSSYIRTFDAPKLEALKTELPGYYIEKK